MEDITNSKIFKLGAKDFSKAAITAIIAGFTLPILAAMQSPEFSIFAANWNELLSLAANGAVVGFASYLIKNFFSDESGKVFGRIG